MILHNVSLGLDLQVADLEASNMDLEDTNTQMEAQAMQAFQERDQLQARLQDSEQAQQRLKDLESSFAEQAAENKNWQVSP